MERLGSFKSAHSGNQPHAGPLLSITDHRRLVINAFMLSIAIFKRNFDELLLFSVRLGSSSKTETNLGSKCVVEPIVFKVALR